MSSAGNDSSLIAVSHSIAGAAASELNTNSSLLSEGGGGY